MRTKHSEKVKLATRLNGGVKKNSFTSYAWRRRAEAIQNRVAKKLNKIK